MQNELVELALRYAVRDGMQPTPLAALQIVRSDKLLPRVYSVHRPSLCFIAQGAKQVMLGGDVFRYATNEFLFSSVDLPITGEIMEASGKRPYLCLVLEIEPSLVFELVAATEGLEPRRPRLTHQAIFVGQSDPAMTDAMLRLLRSLRNPVDARILAPTTIREITYRVLRGPYGDVVRELGIADSQTQRIAKVIDRLKRDYAQPLRAAELAALAGMSVSSFHHHFKAVTTLSPLQYQKQLRLQEARRLLLGSALGAADVAYQVGYESPSQFSREYARCFGLPPASDAKRIAARARAHELRA